MERQAILNASYLDILFDNRNKLYGGYELRNHYAQRIRNATLIVLGTCITLSVFISMHHTTSVTTPHIFDNHITNLTPPPPPMHPIVPPTPVVPVIQHPSNSIVFTPPKIVDANELIDKPAPTVTDLTNKNPGLTNSNNPTSLDPPATSTNTTTTNVVTTSTETKPMQWVEQMPEFDGDVQAYIGSHIHYPELAMENNIQGPVTVRFVVNEDGSVSDVKIIRGIGGGCDEEAQHIVSSMPKWKPGKQNGRPVKVYFTLPIKFILK